MSDPAISAQVQVLAGGSSRAPEVLESEQAGGLEGPFLCGLLHPAIVLPRGFAASLDPGSLRAILAHETSHAQRRDLWWSTLARLLCALLWFQPLLWVLARRLEAAQEEACDQAVLRAGCAPHVYAECLVRLAERRQAGPLGRAASVRAASVGAAPTRSALARRVRQILGGAGDAPPSRGAQAGAAIGALSALILSLGLAQSQPAASSSALSPPQVLAEARAQPSLSPDEVGGIVLDANGRPVAGAWVVINKDVSNDRLLLGRSDAGGRFHFAVPANRVASGGDGERFSCWVTAWAPGWAVSRTEAELEAGRSGVIRLGREVRLHGVVRDQAGRPVQGVPVWLSGAQDPRYAFDGRGVWVPDELTPALTVLTDANGRYEIRGVPAVSTASLEIGDPRFVRRRFAVALSGENSSAPPQVLRPASFVTGRVLGADGKPRAGIEILANTRRGTSPAGEAGWSRGITDSSGTYRIGSLPPAHIQISAQDPTGASVARAIENIVLKPRGTVRAPDIQLRRGGIVRGRVVDRDSGAPVAGALVGGSGGGIFASVASDAQGRYSLRLPAGRISINVSAVPRSYLYPTLSKNLRSLAVTLAEGAAQTYTVRLKKGLSTSGVALNSDGKPAARAWLVAERIVSSYERPGPGSQKYARVGDDGSWELRALTAGRYTLAARGPWQVVEPREFSVPAPEGQAPLRVTLRAVKMPVVEGRVVSGGQPLPGARVALGISVPAGRGNWSVFHEERISDSRGRFRLDRTPADADVWLQATRPGYKYLSGGQVTRHQTEAGTVFTVRDIVLAPGKGAPGASDGPRSPFDPSPRPSVRPAAISASRRAQIEAEVRGGAVISGRVTYQDGRPARVRVWLNAVSEEAEKIRHELNWGSGVDSRLLTRLRRTVATRGDGTFEARGIAPFAYTVMVAGETRGFISRTVRDLKAVRGQSVRARDIILERGGVVRIRLADGKTGQPLRGGLDLGTYNVPHFDNILMSSEGAYPGPDGVGYLTVPAGVASVGLWRNPDGTRPNKEVLATTLGSRYASAYDLSADDIEVSLDHSPRQKKRDGRLSIPIAPGQTHDLTFFLTRKGG